MRDRLEQLLSQQDSSISAIKETLQGMRYSLSSYMSVCLFASLCMNALTRCFLS